MQTAASWRHPLLTILRLADLLVVFAGGYGLWLLRTGTLATPPLIGYTLANTILLTASVFHLAGIYELAQVRRLRGTMRLLVAWAIVLLAMFSIALVTKSTDGLSRIWIVLWATSTPVLLIALRLVMDLHIVRTQAAGGYRTRIAVLGDADNRARFLCHVAFRLHNEVDVVGEFDPEIRHPAAAPPVGSTACLLALCRSGRVDRIVVALPWHAETQIVDLLAQLHDVPVDVDLAPSAIAYRLHRPRMVFADGMPMLSLQRRPMDSWSTLAKLIEDKVLALALLLFTGPLQLLIMLLIKLDSPGPVIFRQARYGYNNKVITIYKFRTMHCQAADDPLARQAQRNDPRVTRIGALLRRYSFDELPQFVNVLQGDMSLVGPRPHAVPHNEHYGSRIDHYSARHNVKPGITGWAQINGYRGETATEELMRKRVEYDLYYIRNWSLLLDFWILLKTPLYGLTSDRAY